jgi:hypothetical protein
MGKYLIKKAYICCRKDKKEELKEKAEKRLKDVLIIRDTLGDDLDFVYVIGKPDADMEVELQEIKEMDIPISYVNENFIAKDMYEKMMEQDKEQKKSFEYEEEKGR